MNQRLFRSHSIDQRRCLWMALVFVGLMTFSISAWGDGVQLILPNANTSTDERTGWAIELDSSEQLGALQLDLLFDSETLDPVSIEADLLLRKAQGGLEFKLIEPGRIRIALACPKPLQGKGPLFRLRGTPTTGTANVALTVAAAQAWESQTLRELRVESTAGVITVVPKTTGATPVPLWVWAIGGGIGLLAFRLLHRK